MKKEIVEIRDFYDDEDLPADIFDSKWFHTRPEPVQQLVRQYPPGLYMVLPGAPYRLSQPGVEVYVVSYGEDGTVQVTRQGYDEPEVVDPKYLKPTL